MTAAKTLDKTDAPVERGDEIELFDGLRWVRATVLSVKWSAVSGWWIEATCDAGTWNGVESEMRKVATS